MAAPPSTRPEITVRIERDSLGDVLVPRTALYGAQTQRALENFPISGLRPWRAFIWSMAVIKRAAAEVNHALGLLDEGLARDIAERVAFDAHGDFRSCGRWCSHREPPRGMQGTGITEGAYRLPPVVCCGSATSPGLCSPGRP